MTAARDDKRPLRITTFPDWRDVNPYQQLLSEALGRQGLQNTLPAGYRRGLPLWRAVSSAAARPDILHLHWPSAYLRSQRPALRAAYCLRTLADLRLVKRAGIRVVWTVHNLVTHDTPTPRLERWFSARLARLADRLIVHSEAAQDLVIKQLGADTAKIAVIPLGPYCDAYGALPDRAAARAALGIGPEVPVALFFGLIRPYKGVPALLRAWDALGDRRGDGLLILAGNAADPNYAAEIRTHAARVPQVRLDMRFVPDEIMLQLLAASDTLVLPFENSLTSSTVRLAQDYGLPVVVPAVPGSAEAQDAILARDTNPEALGQAILEGLASAATCQAKPGMGWDEIADAHRAVYEAALERQTGVFPARKVSAPDESST